MPFNTIKAIQNGKHKRMNLLWTFNFQMKINQSINKILNYKEKKKKERRRCYQTEVHSKQSKQISLPAFLFFFFFWIVSKSKKVTNLYIQLIILYPFWTRNWNSWILPFNQFSNSLNNPLNTMNSKTIINSFLF